MPDLDIVIAVHNEEENIVPLVEEFHEVLKDWDREWVLLFVDDGSSDATRERLLEMRARFDNLRLYGLPVQQGKSAGLAAGFARATAPYLLTFDGDLQNDPRDIPELLKHAAPDVLVCGSRKERRDTASKRIGSRLANNIRRRFLDDDATDTGCGVKVFPLDSRRHIPWIRGVHRFFPSVLKKKGYRIVNVPINDRERKFGRTKYTNIGRLILTVQDLFGFWWYLRRSVRTENEEL